MNIRHASAAALALLMMTSALSQAEQLYVEDKLVLNVYEQADQGSSRVATIETGDAVEEIERLDNFVRVRLADGREGWVGANYLSRDPPAIIRLKELQASNQSEADAAPPKQLTDEIARLQKQNATLSAEMKELKKKASAAPPAVAAPQAAPAVSESITPASLPLSEPAQPDLPVQTPVVQRSYWWAWLLAVVAAAGAGFVAGYQTLGRRVRERFGGVKVY